MKSLFLLGLLFSCSYHHPKRNVALVKAHESALRELDSSSLRSPATNVVKASLDDLQRLTPGKFEVYVFPKISSQNHKDRDQDVYLGPPQVHEVSVIAVAPCKKFLLEAFFMKYRPEDAFPHSLSEDPKNKCAILEITNKRLSKIDKALLRPDDQLGVRLFIDDSFQPLAMDVILYESRNSNRTVRLNGNGKRVWAPLSMFPTDFAATESTIVGKDLKSFFSTRLDPIGIHQIQKKHARNFKAPDCRGSVFQYKDPAGGMVSGGQCENLPWPSYLETDRYFAVTQSLGVR